MNREIKFEHMLIRDSKVIRKETFKLTEAKPGYALIDGMSEVFRQFTGLLDKNGKEIYEGDIVKSGGGLTVEVYWESLDAMYYCRNARSRIRPEWSLAMFSTDGLTVIGNIYESPELLEPK